MESKYIKYYNNENWPLAKKELEKYLEKNHDNHYELALLASIYRIEANFETAFDFISRALKINKHCPWVLWHFADISDMLCKYEWARTIWLHLIRKGTKRLCKAGGCETDLEDSASIINDCRYRLHLSFETENPSLSKRYLTLYKKYVKKGVKSIYSL